jgi:hypothetical protein
MTGLKTLSMNPVCAYYSRNTLLSNIIDEKKYLLPLIHHIRALKFIIYVHRHSRALESTGSPPRLGTTLKNLITKKCAEATMLSVVGPFMVVLLQGLNTSNRGLSIAPFKVRYLDFDDDFAVVVAAILFFSILCMRASSSSQPLRIVLLLA